MPAFHSRSRLSFLASPLALAALTATSIAACGINNADDLFGSGATSGTGGTTGSTATTTGTAGGTGTGGATTTTTGSSSGGGGSAVTTGTGGTGGTVTGTGGSGGTGGSPVACGNGTKEGAEECDGADLGGKTCTDFGFSKAAGLTCDATCHIDSSACKATCDGKLEPGEVCDGANLNGHTCQELGHPGEVGLSCKNCQLDASTCTGSCGNAMLDPGEVCDSPNLNGHTCNDFGYINPNGLTCTNCMLDPVACKPTCGNGSLEPTEVCDTNNLSGKTCSDLGFTNPAGLGCAATCQGYDPTNCHATCNNNVLEPTEACDGNNLANKNCGNFGFTNPNGLKCAGDCGSFDTSNCKTTCNNNIVEPGEACDGVSLNGKTCADFGFVNPNGLVCVNCMINQAACVAVCGNGTKEPGEQCDDSNVLPGDGCGPTCNLEGGACQAATPIMLGLGTQMINGTTMGGSAHTGSGCMGSDGPDQIYAVTAGAAGFLTASLTRGPTNFDSVLYAAASCSDNMANTTILCADSYDVPNNQPLDGGEVLSFKVTNGQVVYLFVDGFAADDSGNFQLVLDLSTGVDCNDPVPIPMYPGAPMSMLGSTVGAGSTAAGTCSGSSGNNPDVVYAVTRSANGTIGVSAPGGQSNYNVVLYSRSDCGSANTQIACANAGGNSVTETLNPTNVTANVPLYVWVDGSSNGTASGNYGLTITP